MSRLFRTKAGKPGLPPGTIESPGEGAAETVISAFDYDQSGVEDYGSLTAKDCLAFKKKKTVTWVNVEGMKNIEEIRALGEGMEVHSLTLEDIVNTDQRPKYEDMESYLFIAVKMLRFDSTSADIISEQVSFVLFDNTVISFQELPGDVFGPVRERIMNDKGRIRKMNADYLLYALIDAVVDNYFIILETFGEQVETVERSLVKDPGTETMRTIHRLKRYTVHLRKSIWPLREVISGIERVDTPLISKPVRRYFRDVYDHTIQVIDTIEAFRDIVTGMMELYLSVISNKMNEVMKVLTIIATIFIPLTFVAGIYGMNFKYMPELDWKPAYFITLSVMLLMALGMVIYFKKKKWL